MDNDIPAFHGTEYPSEKTHRAGYKCNFLGINNKHSEPYLQKKIVGEGFHGSGGYNRKENVITRING
jgi:hypothetical protein